ncbi:MAG: hypothetical protein WKF73_17725, partial [Nocardioidaceae bacterium]
SRRPVVVNHPAQPSVAASQPGTSGDPMVRLVQVAHGMHRTQLDQAGPAPALADERLADRGGDV